MDDSTGKINGRIAPLRNVTLAKQLMTKAMQAAPHLPRMVCLSGPSGFGKSVAASTVNAQLRCYYVECRESWTKRAFLLAVLRDMGIHPAKTIYQMVDQVAEQLAKSQRPLIVDEMDHVVARNMVELVRDIYEASQAAILLIGEELLPQKLKVFERFHGRILDWAQAQPCDERDAAALAALYVPGVKVQEDLLHKLLHETRGSTRRIAVNLDRVRELAAGAGSKSVGLKDWGERPIFTGEPPQTRRF